MGAKTLSRDKDFLVIKNGSLIEYFFKEGVDITIDHDSSLNVYTVILTRLSGIPYRLNYEDFTSPIFSSAQELADTLEQYCNEEDIIKKFGEAPDFDTSDGQVTIWDGANDGAGWQNMVYDYSTTDAIDSVSSSNAGDTQDIVLIGTDINGDEVVLTPTLDGQNRVALGTSLKRFRRGYNDDSTNFAGYIFVYENTAITLGVPNDSSKIRGVISIGENQTLQAVDVVPNGKVGYIKSYYASTSGANKDSSYIIKLRTREDGKVFRTKHKVSISDSGSSYLPYVFEGRGLEVTAGTDIEMTVQMTATGGTAGAVSGGFNLELVDV